MTIKSWTDYFLDLAKTCSSRSNCIRAQVGAVIVGQDKKIKATGYNGTPSGVESCYETCRSIHAEQNAIIQAGQDRSMGASMYIYGHDFICILCKRFIVQAGIKDVYLKKDDESEIKYVSVEDIKKELEATK